MNVSELFQKYGDSVFRLAWSYTGSRQDAEDVTQTVFLRLIEKAPALELGKERAWLFRVAVNQCRSLWRQLTRHRVEHLEEALSVAAEEERPLLRQVMELGREDRTALYLFYYEGYDTREIGEMLHISQSGVTSRLCRARKRLREKLEEGDPYEA